MMRKLTPLALVLAACASSNTASTTATPQTTATKAVTPPPPAVMDPTGSYEFSTVVDGQTVTGTLFINGTTGAYTGRIVTSTFPEIPVTGATVNGKTVDIKGSMPDGELAITITMEADNTFKGKWVLGADTGEFNGKKLPKQ